MPAIDAHAFRASGLAAGAVQALGRGVTAHLGPAPQVF